MNIKEGLLSWRRVLVSDPELWQADLLSVDKLRRFVSERDISITSASTIEGLWQLGFIRADLIRSHEKMTIPGLELVDEKGGDFIYLDNQKLGNYPNGFGGLLNATDVRKDRRLYFHPFRLLVLHHVVRVFTLRASPIQYLLHPPGYQDVVKRQIESLDRWSSSDDASERFNTWNAMTDLAVAFEPIYYDRVFGRTRWRFTTTAKEITSRRTAYRDLVKNMIEESDAGLLEEYRHHLCAEAEMLDDNKVLHVLIRLTKWHGRHDIKSKLGTSMLLLAMAEVIRRAMEEALKRNFPEEDEKGFGQWMPGARAALYGAERVLDAPRTALRNFLSDAGIDFSTRVRCYVEGDTEYGALKAAIGDISGVEIINLRGQVAEKGGKGVAFRESLRRDNQTNVFSFILLDADNKDYARLVKKAAADDLFCGRFFLSQPDFEFGNFSLEELCAVLVILMRQQGDVSVSEKLVLAKADGVRSGRDFFSSVSRLSPNLCSLHKSEEWGNALMRFALTEPKLGGATRSIVTAADRIIWATQCKYMISRNKYRVDPTNGSLIDREGV